MKSLNILIKLMKSVSQMLDTLINVYILVHLFNKIVRLINWIAQFTNLICTLNNVYIFL